MLKATSRRHNQLRLAGSLLALCVAAATQGCSSALQYSPTDMATDNYTRAMITRAVADGNYDINVQDLTKNGGVVELGRVETTDASGAKVSALVPINTNPTPISAPAATVGPMDPSTIPTTTRPDALGLPEPVRPITLQDAIARTMKHSLAIQVEAYNPAIKETQITQAVGAFDPVLFGSSNWTNTNDPLLQAFASSNGQTWANQVGIRQLLPTGGTIQTSFGDTYRDFAQGSEFTVNPSHQIAAAVQLKQPLLRGFGDDVARANIYLAQRDKRIALSTFRRQVIDTVSKVEEAYHTLWQAQEADTIQQDLLQRTWESYDKNLKRTGESTQITIKQAEAAFLQRQAELVRSHAAVRTASDNLKVLINDPDLGVATNQLIVASDRGIEEPIAFSVGDQMQTALRQRGELQEARIQIERADIVINAARNDLLPKVDLTVSAQAGGLDTGFDSALNDTLGPTASNMDWTVGIQIEIPLGDRVAEAALAQHKYERRQAIVQMLNIVDQIITDVRARMREVLTSYQELILRRKAEEAAGIALNALTLSEDVRKDLGPEFLQLKLDAQQRLANARLDKLQAIVNYNVALMHLEQSKGTLLEYNHIAIGPTPRESDAGKFLFLDHVTSK